jgi:hypothetical protein
MGSALYTISVVFGPLPFDSRFDSRFGAHRRRLTPACSHWRSYDSAILAIPSYTIRSRFHPLRPSPGGSNLQAAECVLPHGYHLRPQDTTEKIFHSGTKERIDLTVAPGSSNPQEVHQILLFDSQTQKAYVEDPVSHSCYSAQFPGNDDLANYDPLVASSQPGQGLKDLAADAKLTGTQTVNGLTTKLYESSTVKVWWSDAYDLPIKMEMIQANAPPMVVLEIKELVTAAPPSSLFNLPSGCKEVQGKWTPAGFVVNGENAPNLGAVAAKSEPSPLASPSDLPTHYTLVNVTNLTEASLATGQPSTLKIYRNGSKERIDLTIAPWPANPRGFRNRFLFDFEAHKAYTTAWNGRVASCSWIKYGFANAPAGYDPVTGAARFFTQPGTWKDLGSDTLNSLPVKVEEFRANGEMLVRKVWIAKKAGLVLKYSTAVPGTNTTTGFEVKEFNLAAPPDSLLAAPTGCSETQGEWSDTGISGSTSETITMGASSSNASRASSTSSASPQASSAPAPAPPNLVRNGDFEGGQTGFTSGYAYGNVANPGTYWIGTKPSQAPGAFADWYSGGDHTTGSGNMLVVNGANSASLPVWQEDVSVTPNTTYTFSCWVVEVDQSSNSIPHVQLKINGNAVGDFLAPQNSPDNGGKWEVFTVTWNSGSARRATLALFDLNTDSGWNDFALDDISFIAH